MIYLDNNATTRPAPQVVQAVHEALDGDWGNPSSVHRFGQRARGKLELAREAVAAMLGCMPREFIFTSCGSESVNLAVRGSLNRSGRSVLVTSPLEHSAMREVAQAVETAGAQLVSLPNDEQGRIDLEELESVLSRRANEIALVSIMWANNETGVVQDIAAIGDLCRRYEVRFHTDATQWIGRMPVDVSDLSIDLLSCSAHKLHGPKGIGGLFVRKGVRLEPQLVGGPHERGLRGGTENVAGIVGFGAAAELAGVWLAGDGWKAQKELRDNFERRVLGAVDGAVVHGADAIRLWNTTNIGMPDLDAEPILLMLSESGVCASAGAACSSGSLDPSPILRAMQVPERLTLGSIRFSLSRETTANEIEQAAQIVIDVIARLQAASVG